MAGFYGKLGQPVVESEPVGVDGQGFMVGDLEVITRFHDDFFKRTTAKIKGLASMVSQCDAKFPELNEKITYTEVLTALKVLQLKAPGGDSIPADFLKYGGSAMVNSLIALFNRLFDLGSAPAAWGKALVVLLYKDGDRGDP